jgi:regulator of protease activity HflC (stomatin/prohibitin superfamily)
MDSHLRLKDLFSTLAYSLGHDEQVRAWIRFGALLIALLALGLAGGLIVQSMKPPAARYVEREPGKECIYNADSAPGLGQAESDLQPTYEWKKTAAPSAEIYAQWFIRNISTCAWGADVHFRLVDTQVQVLTDTLSVPAYQFPDNTLPDIPPGNILAPVVPMIAPPNPGSYVTKWRLFAPDGVHWFGPEFTFTVNVATGIEGDIPAQPKSLIDKLSIDLWFVVPALIGIAIALIRAGTFVAQMYSLKSLEHGIAFVANTTLGLPVGGGWITVRHGDYEGSPTDVHEVPLKIGGPGVLSIKDQTAVLTERGARYSRVLGPEDHTLMPFERIRAIYDLRTQNFDGTELSLTKDGIPVRAAVGAMFRFMERMPDEPSSSPRHPRFLSILRHYLRRTPPGSVTEPPVSPEALRMACYEVHRPPNPIKWYQAAFSSATGEVRDELNRRRLDQLFAPDDPDRSPRREIAAQYDSAARASLAARGIELVDSTFGNLQLPREVTAQRTSMWQAGWEKESTITRSASEAEGLLQFQAARAEAQAELVKNIVQAARSMDQNNQLSYQVVEALARAIERTLQRETVLPLSSAAARKEADQALERLLRRLNPPPGR